MKYLVAFLLSCVSVSCSTIPYSSVRPLTYYERLLVYEIIRKSNNNDKKDYYLSRLQSLLNTSEASPEEVKEMMSKTTASGIMEARQETSSGAEKLNIACDEYAGIEEVYESNKHRGWKKYKPTLFGKYFWVSVENTNDILVHIKVHLYGDLEQIKNIVVMEDNIEKHMSVPGFNVNIEFVGFEGGDIFSVKINPSEWPNSLNWSGGGHSVYAHELFHLMGLPDEYDYIENHATNKYLSIKVRLELFLMGIRQKLPADFKDGIMYDHQSKPLSRQVCASVGLKEECMQEVINKNN